MCRVSGDVPPHAGLGQVGTRDARVTPPVYGSTPNAAACTERTFSPETLFPRKDPLEGSARDGPVRWRYPT